jgi:hypothetical protein
MQETNKISATKHTLQQKLYMKTYKKICWICTSNMTRNTHLCCFFFVLHHYTCVHLTFRGLRSKIRLSLWPWFVIALHTRAALSRDRYVYLSVAWVNCVLIVHALTLKSTVNAMCNACFNIERICIVLTQCIYIFHMMLTTPSYYFCE